MALILQKLEAPPVPLLLSGDDTRDIENLNSYLQSLVGYFYTCDAPVVDVAAVTSVRSVVDAQALIAQVQALITQVASLEDRVAVLEGGA